MLASTYVAQLLESERWLNFLESTAVGLQLQLAIISPDKEVLLQSPKVCPDCQTVYLLPSKVDIEKLIANPYAEIALENGLVTYASMLRNGLIMLSSECLCKGDQVHTPLAYRGRIATKLIISFQIAMTEGIEGGQRAVELSTLRQINQITLSLCKGDKNALSNSFDLILSAVIILLDAEGSYLEFTDQDLPGLLIKGDVDAVKAARLNPAGSGLITIEVDNQNSQGKLGILLPKDPTQASMLLPLMAQECAIVLEINNLFRLLSKQLNLVLGAVASAVLVIDKRQIITFANGKAETLLGQLSIDLIGRPIGSWHGPWLTYLKSGTSSLICGEMEPFSVQDDMYWLDWQLSPILEESAIAGWLLILNDRTDYYRWQEAARQAERFATTATMVGSLAHELRNPLSAAKGLLQLMGRKRDPEQTRNYTDLVLRELDRVTRLLNEFLLLGKPANIEKESLDPVIFLQELLPLFQGEAIGTKVKVVLDTEQVSLIAADSGQLTQVMLNLVRNAVQAVNGDGLVTITVRERDGLVRIDVTDTGPGLTPDALNNLFKPFYSTKERGTGLGLPVVQAIIHNHGGKISVSNNPNGCGAVVSVFLPSAALKDSVLSIDVLLSVRDKNFSYPAEQALKSSGLKVISFESLEEAINNAQLYRPTLLVTEAPNDENKVQDLLSNLTCWPNTKILFLCFTLKQPNLTRLAATGQTLTQSFHYLEYPVDFTRFVSKTQRLLAQNC